MFEFKIEKAGEFKFVGTGTSSSRKVLVCPIKLNGEECTATFIERSYPERLAEITGITKTENGKTINRTIEDFSALYITIGPKEVKDAVCAEAIKFIDADKEARNKAETLDRIEKLKAHQLFTYVEPRLIAAGYTVKKESYDKMWSPSLVASKEDISIDLVIDGSYWRASCGWRGSKHYTEKKFMKLADAVEKVNFVYQQVSSSINYHSASVDAMRKAGEEMAAKAPFPLVVEISEELHRTGPGRGQYVQVMRLVSKEHGLSFIGTRSANEVHLTLVGSLKLTPDKMAQVIKIIKDK